MTRIGKPIREVEDVPRPVRAPRIVPRRREPAPEDAPDERELVPVRVPRREPAPRGTMIITEIPYSCPYCGRELELDDNVFYCPVHKVVYVD